MLTLEQRRRHNKRITKAFGKCRIAWDKDIAEVRGKKEIFNDQICLIAREGRNWVLYCAALQLEIRDPTLQSLANQFRLNALLGG